MLHFREELEELQSKLLEMGGLVEAAIHNSVLALVDRDEDKAKEVMWNEALVNQKEIAGMQLLSEHNLRVLVRLCERARVAIRAGAFDEFVDEVRARRTVPDDERRTHP